MENLKNAFHRSRYWLALLAGLSLQPAIAQSVADLPSQLGPRPFYLVDQLEESSLKDTLTHCANNTREYTRRDFSIAHRGAAMQFPEHTKESYEAAARMGAGIIECDVTFTGDGELVCRHAQCDLHTTTNILSTPLAQKCSVPFAPAEFGDNGDLVKPASARCCASDLTLQEFKSLAGKMDAADRRATTVDEYMGGTADFRTDLYATGAMLLSHKESIGLIRSLGAKFTPELKSVTDGFGSSGLNKETYAQKMIQEYVDAGVWYDDVWPQSFNLEDLTLWVDQFPTYARQAVWLDGRNTAELSSSPPSVSDFQKLKSAGINIIAPPMPVLLADNGDGQIVPSAYAMNATAADLDIISWTTERSGRIQQDVIQRGGAFYYGSTLDAVKNDGDVLRTIDVLAQDVGIIGLFSDWPATTTFYANCVGLQ